MIFYWKKFVFTLFLGFPEFKIYMVALGTDGAAVSSGKKGWHSSYNERRNAMDCFCLMQDT